MRALQLLLVLVACSALAQEGVSRGGALRKREYQTYSALTYYVDPTGSDSNACTASGTSACATPQGAIAKLPRFIRHAVTINIAAGTYSGGNLNIDDVVMAGSAPSLSLVGPAQVNATLSTGTPTGAFTAVSNTMTPQPTMTDSGQSWTTDALRGMYLWVTSGTQNGQVRLITGNTGTTLSLASPFSSAPAIGDTYAVKVPAAVISSVGNAGVLVRPQGRGVSNYIFSDLDFISTASNGTGCALSPSLDRAAMALTRVRCLGTGASGTYGVQHTGPGSVTLSFVYASGITGMAFQTGPGSRTTSFFGSFARGTTQDGFLVTGGLYIANIDGVFESGATNAAWGPIRFSGAGVAAGTTSPTYVFARCTDAAPVSPGVRLENSASTTSLATGASNAPISTARIYHLYVDRCETGVLANWDTNFASNAIVCNNVTTCINAGSGAKVRANSVSFSTVTNELQVDGTNYTYSFFTGLSPKRIVGPQGSSIFQP